MVPTTLNEDDGYRDELTRRQVFVSGESKYDEYRPFETATRLIRQGGAECEAGAERLARPECGCFLRAAA